MTLEERNVAEAAVVLSRLTSPEVASAVQALAEAVWEAKNAERARWDLEATDY